MRVVRPDNRFRELRRFFLVSLFGLVVDIAVAWILIAAFAAADSIAAIAGFSIATCANYVGHQRWTFRDEGSSLSLKRFLGFFAVVLVSLAVRLLALHVLGPLLPGPGLNAPLRLGLAAVVSFLFSFSLSRALVFRAGRSDVPPHSNESVSGRQL